MVPSFSNDHVKQGDHDHHQHQNFNEKFQASSSTISSDHVLSYSNVQDRGSHYPREAHQLIYKQEAHNFASESGSSNDHKLTLCLWNNGKGQENQFSGNRYENIPTEWLPSKLRLVRRMMSSDRTANESPTNSLNKFEEEHKQGSSPPTKNSYNSSSMIAIRVCSDCNTTKTPLWRSGPRGPKSLCNACGIRQRKARRALAAAAESTTASKPNLQQKDKMLKINTHSTPCKNRAKEINNNGRKCNLRFEDFLISLSKNLTFHQVFPQDEKEAAILLMALSCDLVHG